MAEGESAHDIAKRHLRQAIDRLQREIETVEFWVGALRGFAEPIPDYDPASLRFPLPGPHGSGRRPSQTRIGMRT